MRNRRFTVYGLRFTVLSIVLLLVACGHSSNHSSNQAFKQSNNYTVTDDYGRTVVVPATPQRVVSLSPAVTEIVYALGAEDILVGRTDFCEYPPEAATIPSIGGISNLNIEKILSLNPDLVISGSMVGKKVTDQMDQMGVPMVCVVEKPKFEALFDNIRAIGRLVGKEHEADSLNTLLKDRASQLPTTHYPLFITLSASAPAATSPPGATPSSTTSSAWPAAAT